MQVIVFTVVLLLAQTAIAQKAMPDFKGVKLGATMAEVSASNPNLSCGEEQQGSRELGDAFCRSLPSRKETIAGVPATWMVYTFLDGKLAMLMVSFASLEFEKVRLAMIEKYGAPSSTQYHSLKTLAGVELRNVEVRWNTPESIVKVERYAGRIDGSSFTMRTHASMRELIRRRDDAGRKRMKAI